MLHPFLHPVYLFRCYTTSSSGAQLATLSNMAALNAVDNDHQSVTAEDFEHARAKLYVGPVNIDMTFPPEDLENTGSIRGDACDISYFLCYMYIISLYYTRRTKGYYLGIATHRNYQLSELLSKLPFIKCW